MLYCSGLPGRQVCCLPHRSLSDRRRILPIGNVRDIGSGLPIWGWQRIGEMPHASEQVSPAPPMHSLELSRQMVCWTCPYPIRCGTIGLRRPSLAWMGLTGWFGLTLGWPQHAALPGSRSKAEEACATIRWIVRLTNLGGSAGQCPCPSNWKPNRDRALTDLSGSYFTVKTVVKVSWSNLRYNPKRRCLLGAPRRVPVGRGRSMEGSSLLSFAIAACRIDEWRPWVIDPALRWGSWMIGTAEPLCEDSARRSPRSGWRGSRNVGTPRGDRGSQAARAAGSGTRFPRSRAVPALIIWRKDRQTIGDWVTWCEEGKLRVLEAKRVFVDGVAILNINDSPVPRLFILVSPRFSQPKRVIWVLTLFERCILQWLSLIWTPLISTSQTHSKQVGVAISALHHASVIFPLLVKTLRDVKLLNQSAKRAKVSKTMTQSRYWTWPLRNLTSLSILMAGWEQLSTAVDWTLQVDYLIPLYQRGLRTS